METPDNAPMQPQVGACFRFEMPVRWGDLDAFGHVNNTVYFRYMEEARVNCMGAAGIGISGAGRALALAHTSCDFLRPIFWPATLQIEMCLQRVGRSSLEYVAELSIVGDDAGPCMRARNVIVGTDPATGQSMPWTPAELQGLARAFASPKS